MAVIPNVDRDRVIPQPSMDVAQHESGIWGRALQSVGRNVAEIGGMLREEQQHLDATQADDAVNKLQLAQAEMTVGQPTEGDVSSGGYVNRRGSAWAQPQVGEKPLLDQYRERFTQARNKIAGNLSPGARARFDSAAKHAEVTFQAGLLQHALRESDDYQQQTFGNTVKAESLTASTNWNNPAAVAESMKRVSEAAKRRAEQVGAADVEGVQQEAVGVVHEAVIEGALRDGNAKFAEEHLNEFKGSLPPKLALSLNDRIQAVRKQQIALEASSEVMRNIVHRMMPSPYDRAAGLAQSIESVVPFNKAIQQSGGDIEKAWAIQHAGKKTVAEAEVQAMKSERENKADPTKPVRPWQDFLPEKTRTYVADNRKAFAAGAGVTAPTLMEVKDMTRRRVLASNPNATAEQVDYAMTKAEQQFNDMRTAQNQIQDNVLLDVQRRIDEGKIRSRHDLTPQDMASLGDKAHAALSYIAGAEANEDKMAKASPAVRETVDRLKASPAILAGTEVSAIMSLAPEIGNANVNDLLKRRNDYINDPTKFATAKIDADAFEVAIAPFIKGVSKGEAALFKHKVRAKVEEEIGARRARGESGIELQKSMASTIAKYAMSYPIEQPGMLWGTTVKQIPGTDLANIEQIPLAPEEVAKIRAKAAKLGLTSLSESDILRVYRMTKAAEAAK